LLERPHPRLNDGEGHPVCAPDFYFPIGPASDVSLRLPGSIVDLDFRYFGVSQATAGPLLDARTLYNSAIHDESRASLTSWLQSAELNVRRHLHPNVAVLAGFRYVQFREQWAMRDDYTVTSGLLVGVIQFADDTIARNELFGLQIGSESLLYSFQRLRLEGGLKAGIFGNAASSTQTGWLSFQNFHLAASEDARRGAVAFVGDINLSATVQLTRNIALRGGYQLLWLAGVSTASDQLAALDHDPYATKTNGSMFFAGATVGLECGW